VAQTIGVDLDADVLAAADALAVRSEEGIGHRFHDDVLRQPLFMNELRDCGLKFRAHGIPSSVPCAALCECRDVPRKIE
jgi:hypothetical protein